jgi:hypothetical protein
MDNPETWNNIGDNIKNEDKQEKSTVQKTIMSNADRT